MHKEALAWSENPRHFDDQKAHYQFNLVNIVFEPNTKTTAVPSVHKKLSTTQDKKMSVPSTQRNVKKQFCTHVDSVETTKLLVNCPLIANNLGCLMSHAEIKHVCVKTQNDVLCVAVCYK